jgi:hypothetical protein
LDTRDLAQRDRLPVVQRDLQVSQCLQRFALLVWRPSHEIGQIDRITNLGDNHSAGYRVQGFGQLFGADTAHGLPNFVSLR